MRGYQTSSLGIGATPCWIMPVTPGEDGLCNLPWTRRIAEFPALDYQQMCGLSEVLRIGSGSGGGNETPSRRFRVLSMG